VAQALFDLHNAAVQEGTLDPHVRSWRSLKPGTNYSLEWNAHEASALKAGVDAKGSTRAPQPRATGVDDKDALVIRFGCQMLRDRNMDSATFAKAGVVRPARRHGHGGGHGFQRGQRTFRDRR
jgi:hypothetical protein